MLLQKPTKLLRIGSALVVAASLLSPADAKPTLPIPDDGFDGGVVSAETLGRGGTIASNIASPAAGSENPAALADSKTSATYTTVLVNTKSDLPGDVQKESDPLDGKVLQYLSFQSEKGVLYYEPLGRRQERQITDPSNPSTDYRDVEFSANAIGFAGADKMGKNGSIGISIAYLWSSISVDEHATGQPSKTTADTANGVRMNLGVRYPTGPAMWGLTVQNGPGFLWWKDYNRTMLPVRARIGNTVRLAPGVLLSADWETRFYGEGSNDDDYFYVGNESRISEYVVLRVGAFGTDLGRAEERHLTAGLTILASNGLKITYAAERFEQDEENVTRSLLSVLIPFETDEGDPK